MRRFFFKLTIVFALCAGLSCQALAHESQPGLLELRQLSANRYEVIWRAPIYYGRAHPARLQLPENWQTIGEPTVRQLPDSALHRRMVKVDGTTINGSIIRFPGLEATITDVFVRVTQLDGSWAYRVVAPVVSQWGKHSHSFVGTFSYANVDRQLRSSLWLSALILAVGLGLTQWVSGALAGEITRDVDRLREGVQRIQEGNLAERVSVSSRDEIEELEEELDAEKNLGFDPDEIRKLDPRQMMKPRDDDTYSPLHDKKDD